MTRNINELYDLAASGDNKAEKELFAALTLAVVAAEYRAVKIETSFAAWTHKIMENRLLGYIQKRRREKGRVISGETNEYLTASWTPDPTLRMRLLGCLKKVCRANPRYARIINLHHLGFSRQEISERLDMTLDQSYVVMSRARAMLKECFDKGDTG
jgi:DNA-directed RNA polymerase specialized sigma24 family protein